MERLRIMDIGDMGDFTVEDSLQSAGTVLDAPRLALLRPLWEHNVPHVPNVPHVLSRRQVAVFNVVLLVETLQLRLFSHGNGVVAMQFLSSEMESVSDDAANAGDRGPAAFAR